MLGWTFPVSVLVGRRKWFLKVCNRYRVIRSWSQFFEQHLPTSKISADFESKLRIVNSVPILLSLNFLHSYVKQVQDYSPSSYQKFLSSCLELLVQWFSQKHQTASMVQKRQFIRSTSLGKIFLQLLKVVGSQRHVTVVNTREKGILHFMLHWTSNKQLEIMMIQLL